MTEEERKELWVNQDYLCRSNKMLFAELRTRTDIRHCRRLSMVGKIFLASIFSLFNILILYFTNAAHEDVSECKLDTNITLTCQFTTFDQLFLLSSSFCVGLLT